jgi:NAD(P)-dependent dehydrogenase (short-subunit alcohol dehydrogenase family)
MELTGKVAVVTGAASGIGAALAERFLAEGMAVVMADIEVPALEERSGALAARHPDRVLAVACDVARADEVRALRESAESAFGTVQLLCNNAGVATGRATWRTRPEIWDWEVGVNLLGPAYGVNTFVPAMVEAGEGHVVNTSSEAGLHASFGLGAYHATKYGLVGLSEALAHELRGTGVGVSCLVPELVDTKIFESTRNAPAHLGLPPPPPVAMSDLEAVMGTTALAPARVADLVVEAIAEQRLWVATHEATALRARARDAALVDALTAAVEAGA